MIPRSKAIQIRNLAREKLAEQDAIRLPVSPKEIAESLNIVVSSFSPEKPDISGFLMQSGNQFGIGYSKNIKNEGFQNFTIAHELGHYFLEGHPMALLRDGKHFSRSGYISKDGYEREADVFATEFLMPWVLINPIINGSQRGFKAIKHLSERCNSSLLASAVRYTEVSQDSVAVIVSYKGNVEFMTASDSFTQIRGIEWLRRNDPLPQLVPSRILSSNAAWIELGEIKEEGSNLRDWFPSAQSAQLEEDIVGLGCFQRVLTVLVSDLDPAEEAETESEEDDYIERWKEGRYRAR